MILQSVIVSWITRCGHQVTGLMASINDDDDHIGKERKDRGNRKEREAIVYIILGQGDCRGRVGLRVSVWGEYPFGVNQWCLCLFLVN